MSQLDMYKDIWEITRQRYHEVISECGEIISIFFVADEGHIGGYSGFYLQYTFDKEGSFIQAGVYE